MDRRITIENTQPQHRQGVYDTVRLAYEVPLDVDCPDCINPTDVDEQLVRFPEGQFVAVYGDGADELVVGIASTMRISRPPTEPPRSWEDEIGAKGIVNHNPNGEWLYGVEMAVRPDFRRQGVGTVLYQARFDLVKHLNLKGWYAGGMLMGYYRYQDSLTPKEYGEKVISRDIVDPTVTMQMNRGFEAWSVIENYLSEPDAGDAAVHIVWLNPDYREA